MEEGMNGSVSTCIASQSSGCSSDGSAGLSALFKPITASQTEDVAAIALPASQASDSGESLVKTAATIPLSNCDDMGKGCNALSESDECSSKASDDGEITNDEGSVHLSEYDSNDAISFVESCSSVSNFSDSSSSTCTSSTSKQTKRKRKSSSCISRRRTSNSDSEDSDSEHEPTVTNKNDNGRKFIDRGEEEAESESSGNADEDRSPTKVATESDGKTASTTSTDKIVSIWDVDADNEPRRPVNKSRKLWTDRDHLETTPGQPRGQTPPGRNTRYLGPSHGYQRGYGQQGAPFGRSAYPNNCPKFPSHFAFGLGRGITRNDSKRFDANMRPSGPPQNTSWNYTQNRRQNNPYCHYQQHQRYFAMPRGSYASVVQRAPPARNVHQENPTSSSQKVHNAARNPNYKNNSKENQSVHPYSHTQSYNRGKATAAQILQQQRDQQAQRQQQNDAEKKNQEKHTSQKMKCWQPPSGPGVKPITIGEQRLYIVEPSSGRPLVAEEDPAIIRAIPPTPRPFVMFPGGAQLPLTQGDAQGDNTVVGGIPQATPGGTCRNDKQWSSQIVSSVGSHRFAQRPARQNTSIHNRLSAFSALPYLFS
ncbi:uncharacterized protein [Diadema setosum]|uniref:uncharacterized protein n=1 Tax=Diadema setosum TaxID=31175 RepID=UPI003B3A7116